MSPTVRLQITLHEILRVAFFYDEIYPPTDAAYSPRAYVRAQAQARPPRAYAIPSRCRCGHKKSALSLFDVLHAVAMF